jgi:hypothetical protein
LATTGSATPKRAQVLITTLNSTQTWIPGSTRQFQGYVYGDANWTTLTRSQVVVLTPEDPFPYRPFMNDKSSLAGTPPDLLAFYSSAPEGKFFRCPQTLTLFHVNLSWATPIAPAIPLGSAHS